jgi:hypothetical protein
MDVGLRSLGRGARADQDQVRGDSAAERAAEKICAACGNFSRSCRLRDDCDVTYGAESDRHDCEHPVADDCDVTYRAQSERHDCQDEAVADDCDVTCRSESERHDRQDEPVTDRGRGCKRINHSRCRKPDSSGCRQHGLPVGLALAKTQDVSDDPTEYESADRCRAGNNAVGLDDARDPNRHVARRARGQRHACHSRAADDQPNDQTPAIALHSAAADPDTAANSTHDAAFDHGPACGCRDHASYDTGTGIHSAAETAERFAATRSSNRDSR